MSSRSIAAAFFSFVAVGVLWAIAMPLNAGPDEDQHMIWAATTARLQLEPRGEGSERTLRAPDVLYVDHCLQFDPDTTADCQDHTEPQPGGDSRNLPVTRAAPYYLAIGIPSLITTTESTAYLMRAAHILLTSALLTLGVWNIAHRRPSPGSIALATVAFTPMVAFLIGTVNPSGPAIASGFAMWTGGLFLLPSGPLNWRRAALIAAPVVVFLVVRQDALIWTLLIFLGLAIHSGSPRLLETLRPLPVRALLLTAGLGIVGWYVLGGHHLLGWLSRAVDSSDRGGTASESFGVLPLYAQQMIGQLGWLDVTLPQPVLLGWYSLVVLALLLCVGASRRDGATAAATLVVVFVVAYIFDLLIRHRYYFQGRYGLPFALGVPMIASAALCAGRARDMVPARMARAVVWTVATLSSIAFAVALRRYTVGHRGPWLDMLFDPVWAPPLPSWILVVAYVGLMAALATILCRLIAWSDRPAVEVP